MADKQEIILEYIKRNGPVLPIEIGKMIKSDSMIASALLSGMLSMKQLKVSKMKIGGSPLYFAPGQEPMLQKYFEKLGMGEKAVFKILKEKKVLRDKEIGIIQQEALKRIKDFAVMLEVEMPGKGVKEIFWKWYLLSDAETEAAIREILNKAYEQKKPERDETKAPAQKIQKPEAVEKQEKKKPESKSTEAKAEIIPAEEIEEIDEQKEDVEFEDEVETGTAKKVKRKILKKKELEKKSDEERKGTKFRIEEELLKIQEEEKKIKKDDKPKTPAMLAKEKKTDEFVQIVQAYFAKNEIVVVDTEIVKPNEIDFTIKVPSAVGKISYYCKAKSKKSVNEGDLSTAFVQGQLKKLPVLLVTNGKLTKRASEMLEKQFQHMSIGYLGQ